jgi:hypothetical protein
MDIINIFTNICQYKLLQATKDDINIQENLCGTKLPNRWQNLMCGELFGHNVQK